MQDQLIVIDLPKIVQQHTRLEQVSRTGGGEYHGPCPVCGGTDRFVVQRRHQAKDRWFCRQCTPRGGDALDYIQFRDGCDFATAWRTLGLRPGQRARRARASRAVSPSGPPVAIPPSHVWQTQGKAFCERAYQSLWSLPVQQQALAYLQGRGLSGTTLKAARIGYLPKRQRSNWDATPIRLPQGIVIPWLEDSTLWQVKLRTLNPEAAPKYQQAAGGARTLYGLDQVQLNGLVVLTEGKFDALCLRQEVGPMFQGQPFAALATGSTGGGRTAQAIMRLQLAERVLVAFDADAAGDKASGYWEQALPGRTRRLRPLDHDVNAMLLAGRDLTAWVASGL